MPFLFNYVILILMISCSHQAKSSLDLEKDVEKVTVKMSSSKSQVAVVKPRMEPIMDLEKINGSIGKGEVRHIQVVLKNPENVKTVLCHDKEIPYYTDGKTLELYLAESYFSNFQRAKCDIVDINGERHTFVDAKVVEFNYKSEQLYVDKKTITLSPKDQERVQKEQEILNGIYAQSHHRPLFEKGFVGPVQTKITSYYGTKRVYNDKKQSQHLGIDFRAPVGFPIKTSNKGKVVFTGNLFFTGNTVIMDHGLGIFTVYAHLSKILTQVGEIVPRQAQIGLAGMTGRVTGPHLHWGVKVHGNWVGGHYLINTTRNL